MEKNKGGRPKGSKNKKTLAMEAKVEKMLQERLRGEGIAVPEPTYNKAPVSNASEKVIGFKVDYGITEQEYVRKARCWNRIRTKLLPKTANIIAPLLNKYEEVVKEEDRPLMKKVMDRAEGSFSFFTRHFIKIVDVKGNKIPLELNRSQRITHCQHLRHFRATGYGRTIILKARQQGLTTYTNARCLHHGIYKREAYSILMAVNQSNSSDNLTSIRSMFRELPKWVQNYWIYQYAANTGDHKDSASEMQFDSHISQSSSRFVTANANGDGPRGKRANFFHWTETAFCEESEEAFTAITPMIRKRPGAPFIIESTANGLGNWFANQCINIHKGGLSTFHLVFLPWHIDESNRITPPEDFELTGEETRLRERYGLEDDQLFWRRLAIADENGDIQKFNQEYPISVEAAFMSSDNLYFTPQTQEIVENSATETPVIERFDLKEEGISMNPFGNVSVFSQPVKEYEYVVGIDCSEGVGADYVVAVVLDPYGRSACILRDNQLRPDQAAAALVHVAKRYNNAKVVIERGGIGTFFAHNLQTQLGYGNLFFDNDGRVGFKQTGDARKRILAQFQQDLVEGKVVVPYQELVSEMETFEIAPNGKPQHKKGYHDDIIFAGALATEAFHRFTPRIRDIEEFERPIRKRRFAL